MPLKTIENSQDRAEIRMIYNAHFKCTTNSRKIHMKCDSSCVGELNHCDHLFDLLWYTLKNIYILYDAHKRSSTFDVKM